MRPLSALLLALTLLPLGACTSEPDDAAPVLRFTAIPDVKTTELKQKFDPVADYLSEKLGVEVEYVPSSDYGASVEMFRNGDVHLAWFGGLTGVQARRLVDGARAVVQGAEDPKFKSYFIVHDSVEMERTEEFPQGLASLKFTFGSEKSTSGRLMPEFYIRENTGKAPREFFQTTPGFSGSHPKTAEQVNAGTYEAGALNYQVYDAMKAEGKVENTHIVWVTPPYADYNMTVHPAVEEMFGAGFTDKLQDALTSMPGELAQSSFGRSKLIEATNAEFEGIEKVAEQLGLLRGS